MARSLLYLLRDVRSRALFTQLERYCRGRVLDVGGGQFFQTVADNRRIEFTHWTSLEPEARPGPIGVDRRYEQVQGDGCAMTMAAGSFDTVLNIQVLEHVPEPFTMMREMSRVLQSGGHLVLLVPQTSALHMVPHHYYNFTRFWVVEACRREGLELLQLEPQGGVWSSIASSLFYFFLKALKVRGFTTEYDRRTPLFYLLLPFMALWAVVSVPVCMLFSLADLTEEPNNWIVVARKP